MWNKDEQWTDDKLLEAMRQGGPQLDLAFKIFHNRFRLMVFSQIKSFGLIEEDSHEIIADTFISITKRIANNPGFKFSFSTYVYTSIQNKCIQIKSRNISTASLDEIHYDVSVNQDIDTKILAQEVLQRINVMGEPCKTILTMRAKGYEHAEIAKQLQRSEQTIKGKTVECRKTLINLIGGKKLY